MTDTAIKPEVEAAIESVLDAELYELPATYSEVCRYMRAAIAAYLAASGLAEERVVIDNRHPDCHHELCDQITELTARAERLQAELAEAHGYGSRLFLRLNPQCEVFDNMPGLMTQFDNYIAGQLQDIAAEKAAELEKGNG